jgi:putative nucleotidyltransferase with HDIG domain
LNKRVKQVVAALTARIEKHDQDFLSKNLSKAEAAFFYQMNLPDQRHALNVAYTALELADGQEPVDRDLLVKCALLHDVGKVKGDVSTADKIITVLFDTFAPVWAKSWGRQGRGGKIDNLRHAVYIYYNHATRGAAMLTAAGLHPQVTQIIARHHEAPAVGEPPELTLLRAADNLN